MGRKKDARDAVKTPDDAEMTGACNMAFMTTPNTPEVPHWDLKTLVAWQVAMDFAELVYRKTYTFPKDEKFGLRMQVRRSAVSVASNIAEGHGRTHRREFARFVLIARGSLKEAETQLLLAARLGFLSTTQSAPLLEMATRLNRLLTGLRRRLGD